MKHMLFVAKAFIFATLAAVIVGGVLLESGLDRLVIGFLAGGSFVGVLAFFNAEGKGRFY
jgi:hypothetical protein